MQEPAPSRESAVDPRIVHWILCAVSIALLVFAALRFFFGGGFDALLSSDASVPALLAEEMLRSRSLLPDTWYFANDEIWTLSPHVFVLPFVALLGVSPLALKIGNLLVIGATLGLVALLLRRVTGSWPFSVTIACSLLACFSELEAAVVYVQTAYGWFCAQLALLTWLALRMNDDRASAARQPVWITTLYVLFVLAFGASSPLRVLVYWMVPLAIVSIAFRLAERQSVVSKPLVLGCAALAAGVALHWILDRQLLTVAGTTADLVGPPRQWMRNLAALARDVPVLAGSQSTWSQLATPSSVAGIVRNAFMVLAPIVAVLAWRRSATGHVEDRLFMRLAGAMLVVVIGAFALRPRSGDSASIRYLVPQLLLGLAALMAWLWRRWGASSRRLIAVTALFVLAFGGGGALLATKLASASGSAPSDCGASVSICRLQASLLEHGLHKGYATYWNAGVTTLASRARVTVCGIVLKPRIAPFRWLVSKDCFDPPREDRYFIALSANDREGLDRNALIAETGPPDEIVKDGAFEILIYETMRSRLAWLSR